MAKTPPPPVSAPVTKEINGNLYGTRYMDPETLLQHAGKLSGMSAGALLRASAQDSGLMGVIKDFFQLANVNGKELRGETWKIHFLGKGGELVLVIGWLLEVHFGDFFVEVVSVGKGFKERFGGLLASTETEPQ